ncbi:hypothetical protein [Streptomyces sp. NPDC087300]|uniref:hypothetical protein n=1 Tax=Streptomyces sp. NPDC087300 TaxID=3365780 RepID=UPI003828626D
MGSDGGGAGPGAQDEPVCGHCGQNVGTAIRRRKVLGVFVPVWGPGPCRNAECEACVVDDEGGEPSGRSAARRRGHGHSHSRVRSRGRPRDGEAGEGAAPSGAEGVTPSGGEDVTPSGGEEASDNAGGGG